MWRFRCNCRRSFLNSLSYHYLRRRYYPYVGFSYKLRFQAVFVSWQLLFFDSTSLCFPHKIAPCVNNTKVRFLWNVSCSDAKARLKVETSSSFMTTKTKAALSITKGVLTTGVTCTFSVTVAMDYDPNVKSMASVNIKALPSPLAPAIVGGLTQFVFAPFEKVMKDKTKGF